jgi:hypothetical protein
MGKYVKVLTEADLQAEVKKDPEFAKFLAEKGLTNKDAVAASLEVMLPQHVKDWLMANETKECIEGAHEAFTRMLGKCADMLIPSLPSIVRRRITPAEAMEVLADEVVRCVFAVPFKEAGEPIDDKYVQLSYLTVSTGAIGVPLTSIFACSQAASALHEMAKTREDRPDIDPALASKATHREHATVN